MIENVRIEGLRCLPGASADLPQKTACLTLRITGNIAAWHRQTLQACQAGTPASSLLTQALAELLPTQTIQPQPLPELPVLEQMREALQQHDPLLAFAQAVRVLCVALQREARDAVWRGAVLQASVAPEGHELRLALPYEREAVLKEALQWSIRWCLLWGYPADPPSIQAKHGELMQAWRAWLETAQTGGLAPNTLRFALAAYARSWPVRVEGQVLRIGWGAQRLTLDSSFTGQTAHLAARTARDKHLTSRLLHQAGLPVPPTARVRDWDGALQIARQLGWPVVVKPGNQDQGTAVVPGIRDEVTLRRAYEHAEKFSPGAVIVEKHIPGDDHRLLVVQGRLLMATRRVPGGVTGDGRRTVAERMEAVNTDPRRGTSKRSLLIQLAMDDEALACLAEQGLTPDSVPTASQFVRLRRTANISTGGTAEDVSAVIHPDNRLLAERAARIIGLDIAGVDFLCPDITRSWREVGGAICEVNAQPGFRPHWLGDLQRDINGEILDILMADRPPRIPTAAITGTNGKTTTARMLHHIWQTAGKVTGVCTTQGVWVGQDNLTQVNLSGFPGARLLLEDPAVEAAVLEMPRKGLIRFGHPCDRYDVAALLNVQDDHIGVDGIETLEQMAELKAEVLQRARLAVVINADDDRCLAMRARAGCSRHILVARCADNAAVQTHRQVGGEAGGEAVYVDLLDGQPWIVLAEAAQETPLMPLHEIPATMNGLLKFNESNALFAVALAWAQGLPLATIRQAMAGFHNSPEQNPGRYNFIDGLPFQVLVDYGHNPAGMDGLLELVKSLPVKGRRILVNTNGLRYRHHLAMELPQYPKVFDEIHLGLYEDYFRRFSQGFDPDDPLEDMFRQARALLMPLLRPDQQLNIKRQHTDALRAAVQACQPGDLLVILSEWEDAQSALDTYRRAGLQVVPHEA